MIPFSWFKPKLKNRDQLLSFLREAQENGVIDPHALRMCEGVLQASEMVVSEIMLPRSEMLTLSKDASLEEILPIIIKSGHSRFPVIGENKDEVIGILLSKDLLHYTQQTTSFPSLKELLRPAIFIPEKKPLNTLLEEFRKKRHHLAIVVDEYGGVSGLITIEDVLEQIVGEIEDEHDPHEHVYIRKHKNNDYSIKAITPIEEFNEFFNTTLDEDQFDTIGGLVLKGFGHLPKRGESIRIQEILFTVLRANNRRIQLLQVTLSTPHSSEA